ncbi:hypothetical protein BDK51DRAFT_29806 [Blyttiomyces helicus]|uniref:HAMP domain-containing protein n=1 Tax=Blyttiomyces helicus TaxID=388810 RepID=A0A4P9W637_9FUNG|nr:hypothetical protein BDK51DRAFT_29806 [Blyttiomyces helicus]|eukprot:RKO86805.1 hypothetical protein BDK51DRAFT_29806 [Blyttiomyces helicus]
MSQLTPSREGLLSITDTNIESGEQQMPPTPFPTSSRVPEPLQPPRPRGAVHLPLFCILSFLWMIRMNVLNHVQDEGCHNVSVEIADNPSVDHYLAGLRQNRSAAILDYPAVLYGIAQTLDKVSEYSATAGLKVMGGDSIVIPDSGEAATYCTHTTPSVVNCRHFTNEGIQNQSLLLVPTNRTWSVSPSWDALPVGNYSKTGPQWIYVDPVADEASLFRSCNLVQTLDFGIGDGNSSKPTGVIFSGSLPTSSVAAYLETIHLTPNSLVAVWEFDGTMWGASQGELARMPDPSTHGATQTVANAFVSENPLIHAAAGYINRTYPSWAAVGEVADQVGSDAGLMLLNARVIDDGMGLSVLAVVMLPESDYLSTIIVTRNQAVAVGTGVAFAMLLLAGALSFLVTLPLRRFIRIMERASNYDFNGLDLKSQRRPSVVSEIADMQTVFSSMLEKFTEANQVFRVNLKRPFQYKKANKHLARNALWSSVPRASTLGDDGPLDSVVPVMQEDPRIEIVVM